MGLEKPGLCSPLSMCLNTQYLGCGSGNTAVPGHSGSVWKRDHGSQSIGVTYPKPSRNHLGYRSWGGGLVKQQARALWERPEASGSETIVHSQTVSPTQNLPGTIWGAISKGGRLVGSRVVFSVLLLVCPSISLSVGESVCLSV